MNPYGSTQITSESHARSATSKNVLRYVAMLTLAIFLSGCSTMSRPQGAGNGALIGAGIGALAGGGIGAGVGASKGGGLIGFAAGGESKTPPQQSSPKIPQQRGALSW